MDEDIHINDVVNGNEVTKQQLDDLGFDYVCHQGSSIVFDYQNKLYYMNPSDGMLKITNSYDKVVD